TGGREVREARIFGWRCRHRVCGTIASSTPPASSRKIFLISVLRKQKCVLASRTSRPPVLPVIWEVLETTCRRGKQPEALAQVGLATPRQFLQEICGLAARR